MSSVLVVQVGSTVSGLVPRRGDFDDWFRAGLAPLACVVVRPHEGEALPRARDHSGVVVTGSSAMATEAPEWSRRTEAWLADAARSGVAVLGVCYGHHLLARALGGEVGWNANGREIGTVEVAKTPLGRADRLLADTGDPLVVQATHSQSVLVLPPGARRLAHNPHDEHQAFACGTRAWGVQFHPEFDADVVRGYLDERREELVAEGLDPDGLRAAARDSADGAAILRAFGRVVEESA